MRVCVLFIPELKDEDEAESTALCLDHGLDIRVEVVGAVAVDAMMMMSVLSVSVKRERCASTPWWARCVRMSMYTG